jgi:transposase
MGEGDRGLGLCQKRIKAQAVELMRTGKPVAELAEELCVSTDLLYRWIAWHAGGERPAAEDLRALLREDAQLRMENDILKMAAIILGTKSPHNSAK